MDKILLQQHFFGSVPAGHGLTGNRGFQTIARSAGAGEERSLEEHCDYEPPEDHTDGPLPVNWGWFALDEGRACLHRIGDAGTDEIGRTGNFLAHNLVMTTGELEAIDYDIPALFRWVSERSPVRYPTDSGEDDGFASFPWHINERFGTNADQLGSIPPLVVPISEVRAIRERMDRQLGPETVGPLRTSLGQGGMGALLSAILCPREARRPVVIFGMVEDSESPTAQRRLVDFLFSILPTPFRRRLTFATYQPTMPEAEDYTSSRPAYRRRRILLLPRGTGKASRQAQVTWIVGCDGRTHVIPNPPATLARRYEDLLLKDSGLTRIVDGRLMASRFEFDPDEFLSLKIAQGWVELCRQSKFDSTHVEWYSRNAACIPAAFHRVIELGHTAVSSVKTGNVRLLDILPNIVKGYTDSLSLVLPTISAVDLKPRLALIRGDLLDLLELLMATDAWLHIKELIRTVGTSVELRVLAGEILDSFSPALERILEVGDIRRLASAWDTVSEASDPSQGVSSSLALFRTRIANHLMGLLLQPQTRVRGDELLSHWESMVLPILLEAPFSSVSELNDRFVFLEEIGKERGIELSSGFIVEIMRSGRLSAEHWVQEPDCIHRLILSFYRSWEEASRVPLDCLEPLQRLVGYPDLAAAYWRTPPVERDSRLHSGMDLLLGGIRSKSSDSLLERLFQIYTSEGCASLYFGPEDGSQSADPAGLASQIDAHCSLLEMVSASRKIEDSPEIRNHWTSLLAFLLSRSFSTTPEDSWSRKVVERAAISLIQWFPTCSLRVSAIKDVAREFRRLRSPDSSAWRPETRLLQSLRDLLLTQGLAAEEVSMHILILWIASGFPTHGKSEEQIRTLIRVEASTKLLLKYPDLAAEAPGTEFGQYFQTTLDQSVWKKIERRMLAECSDQTTPEAARNWLVNDGPRRFLLDQLEQFKLLEIVGRELAERLGGIQPTEAAFDSLESILALDPRNSIREPAFAKLKALVCQRIDDLRSEASQGAVPLPPQEVALRDLALCRPIVRLSSSLNHDQLRVFGIRIGLCLAALVKDDTSAYVSFVASLSEALQKCSEIAHN